MTHGRGEIRRLLTQAGITPRKSLGQNFVADPNTVRRIATLAEVGAGSRVVEIGAGLGSLTLALASTGACVLAIETDPKLVEVLRDVLTQAGLSGDRVRLLEADATKLNWSETLRPPEPADREPTPWQLVSNLPYNISTRLVIDVLEQAPQVASLLVMCQTEAAERLAADAGQPAYGAVSVRVKMLAEAELVGTVPPTVFVPAPKVSSSLVRITRADRLISTELAAAMKELLRAGFGTRRKMLRRSLRQLCSELAGGTEALLGEAGIDARLRPEQVDLGGWMSLGEALCSARQKR